MSQAEQPTKPEKITPQTNPPMLIVFLDSDDVKNCQEELKDVDTTKVLAKPLSHLIATGFELKLDDYDGVVYYSKATLEFLQKNRKSYVDINRKRRRENMFLLRKHLRKRNK